MKMLESYKIEKYLDLPRKQRNLWNVKVTVIPIIVGALWKVPKDLEMRLGELKIRGRIVTIQTSNLRRVLFHTNSIGKTMSQFTLPLLWVNCWADWVVAKEGKLWIQTSLTPLKTVCHTLSMAEGLGKHTYTHIYMGSFVRSNSSKPHPDFRLVVYLSLL